MTTSLLHPEGARCPLCSPVSHMHMIGDVFLVLWAHKDRQGPALALTGQGNDLTGLIHIPGGRVDAEACPVLWLHG